MNAKYCIFVCRNFQKEVAAAIAIEGWNDVVAMGFEARCGKPPLDWEELRMLLPEDCSRLLIMGSACLSRLGAPPPDFPPVRLLQQEQCFNMIAPGSLVSQLISDNGYLITPGWLADWRGQLAKLGYTGEMAGQAFREFAQRLVLLDTGVEADAAAWLAEMAETLGLPTLRLMVGLDSLCQWLGREVLEFRLVNERLSSKEQKDLCARELADHAAAMDMLASLTKTSVESEALAAIEHLFRMLFAPAVWHYVQIQAGKPKIAANVPPEFWEILQKLDSPYALTPSRQGFVLRIARDEQVLGGIVADGFAFPEYTERYLNLALTMSGIFALAIDNARTRKQLLEAEKLASLGVLVAGVAHEINTPLGVSLMASSTIQEQSAKLALGFAERRMTQSDLLHYLESTKSAVALIGSNLERIGHLVDTFRQVVLERESLSKRRFSLKKCLDDVIAVLSEKLTENQIEIGMICDADLEIESYPGDWASILTNLLTNSVRHGFKDRNHGHIQISMTVHDGRLVTDYTDDGIGLSKEVLKRIFNPFFTTDMQSGMGLGMYFVHNLVTLRLGGSIDCDSPSGSGAHFHIETPL